MSYSKIHRSDCDPELAVFRIKNQQIKEMHFLYQDQMLNFMKNNEASDSDGQQTTSEIVIQSNQSNQSNRSLSKDLIQHSPSFKQNQNENSNKSGSQHFSSQTLQLLNQVTKYSQETKFNQENKQNKNFVKLNKIQKAKQIQQVTPTPTNYKISDKSRQIASQKMKKEIENFKTLKSYFNKQCQTIETQSCKQVRIKGAQLFQGQASGLNDREVQTQPPKMIRSQLTPSRIDTSSFASSKSFYLPVQERYPFQEELKKLQLDSVRKMQKQKESELQVRKRSVDWNMERVKKFTDDENKFMIKKTEYANKSQLKSKMEEMRDCTHSPKILRLSKQMVSQHNTTRRVEDRLIDYNIEKEVHRRQLQQQHDDKEMKQFTSNKKKSLELKRRIHNQTQQQNYQIDKQIPLYYVGDSMSGRNTNRSNMNERNNRTWFC